MPAFEHMWTVTPRGSTLSKLPREAARDCFLAGILIIGGIAAGAVPAQGQTVRSGGDSARAMQELQQLAAERTALQADNAKLKDEVADLKKKLDKAATEGAGALARAKQLELTADRGAESGKQAAEALEKSRAQMQELITRFRQTALDLQGVETDRNSLRGQLDTRSREYNLCVEHNVGMYDVGREALDRLDKHGFWSQARESEPFTQLARVRLDNLIDGYRQRLEELRVEQSKKNAAEKPH
jgi:type I site-specific restriction endonuclease